MFFSFLIHLILSVTAPRRYLYSWLVTKEILPPLVAFKPEVRKKGFNLARKIQLLLPGHQVHFVGSARYGIDGRGDIDIVIKADSGSFSRVISKLTPLIGQPEKRRRLFVDYTIEYQGMPVDITLMDERFFSYRHQIRNFLLMRSNSELRDLYLQVKRSAVGHPEQTYIRRQLLLMNLLPIIHRYYSFSKKRSKSQ